MRIARPGAIYDDSADAQTFHGGKTIDTLGRNGDFPETNRSKIPRKGGGDFDHMAGFSKSLHVIQSDVSNVGLLKKNERPGPSKTHFVVSNLIFLKRRSGNPKAGVNIK